jgi:hypothetical protein
VKQDQCTVISSAFRPYLDDVSRRIDEREEQSLHTAWHRFLDGGQASGIFVAPARRPQPPSIPWRQVNINHTLHDTDLMLLHQFAFPSRELESGSSAVLGVRCAYGVSIMVSQLGCQVLETPRTQGHTPTLLCLPDEGAIRAAIAASG